jgi:hypothetical protein
MQQKHSQQEHRQQEHRQQEHKQQEHRQQEHRQQEHRLQEHKQQGQRQQEHRQQEVLLEAGKALCLTSAGKGQLTRDQEQKKGMRNGNGEKGTMQARANRTQD